MAKKYNHSLLSALNSVRAGKDTPFVIGYTISKSLMKKSSIANRRATSTEIEQDIVNALEVWKNIFNTLYSANRKIKGSLQTQYKNNSESSNDINISIKKSNSILPVEIKGSTIFLSSRFNWKALKYNGGIDIFSHVVYGIGKIFNIPDSHNNNSMMSLAHLKNNYAPFYQLVLNKGRVSNPLQLLDVEVSKNILKLYGSLNYAYRIVYGCTDPNADNFNPKATRSSSICKYNNRIKDKSSAYYSPTKQRRNSY